MNIRNKHAYQKTGQKRILSTDKSEKARMAIVDSLNQEVSTSFVAFVEACNSVTSRDDFLLFVYPKLREIVPHKIFAFYIGVEERNHTTFRVSPGAADEKLCQITAVDNCMVKLLIQ